MMMDGRIFLRGWLIFTSLLVVLLVGVAGYFFIFGKSKDSRGLDPTTLCLTDFNDDQMVVLIDQTGGIDDEKIGAIGRRLQRIASKDLPQFGRLSLYRLTPDNKIDLVGYVCYLGRTNKAEARWEESWEAILGMGQKQAFDYYKKRIGRLVADTQSSSGGGKVTLMAGIKSLKELYDKNDTAISWLIIFSPLHEASDEFVMANQKKLPPIADFWSGYPHLRGDFDKVAVGLYYFWQADRVSGLKRFWQDYFTSQGAELSWFRVIK